MRKPWLIFFILIFLAMAALIWRQTRASGIEIKTDVVKSEDLSKIVSASGKITSEEVVELKFQTSGLLAWVGVKEGDQVQTWQAVAQLDTQEMQKTLEKYLHDYSKERNDFEQDLQGTYRDQIVTDTIKRILEKNQWDLDKAVLDVELKDIALKFATLVSPISGIVTKVETPVAGVNITPATAVFKVANPEKMVFEANIDEADISGITTGLPAKISLDAYPEETFEGNLGKVSFSSVTTSGGGTAFPTQISLPVNDNFRFKIGMNGDVDITLQTRKNVLAISSEAIFEKEGRNFVWLIKNGKATKREVKLGLVTSEKTQILEGLLEGDKVVRSPVSKIKEGQRLDVRS